MSQTNTSWPEGGSKRDPAVTVIRTSPAHAPVPRPKIQVHESAGATSLTPQFALGVLRRRWFVALSCGILLAAAAVGAVYLTFHRVYQATAMLQITENTPYVAFPSQERSRRFLQTQMELVRSPLVLGPVVSRPEIAKMPEIQEQNMPIQWLATKLKASPRGESEYVDISYDSRSPAGAALVVNAVVDTYLNFRGRNEAEQTQRVLELLEEERGRRMREVDSMRENIRALAKQATGKDPFTPKSQSESQGPQRSHPLADLQAKLVGAEVERQILEARVTAFKELVAKEVVDVGEVRLDRAVEEHPNIQALRAGLMKKKAQLQEYEQTLLHGAKDPSYLSLSEKISLDEAAIQEARKKLREDIRKELAENLKLEHKDGLAKLHAALDEAKLMERMFREKEQSLLKDAKEATGDTLQLEFKQADLLRAEQVLAMIAERAVKLRAEQRAPERVTLLSKAEAPVVPLEWLPYKRMIQAGLAGLCLPLLLIVGLEWFARRVSDSHQIELQTRLPVLGEITQLPTRSRLSPRALMGRAGRDAGLFEESINGLRTCLLLSEPLREMQVVAITSASSSEGKTSIAVQLAVSIARASGQKTLLIDADMRSPDIHRLLNLRRGPGLAEVLNHQCSVQDGIVTDWNDLVHVLPAGKLTASPHKLVGNGALTAALEELRPLYRYIVIDTPPILPASEALVLARAADVCLVCAMRDVSRIDRLRRTSDRLVAAGARPVGIVLSGVPTHEYVYDYGSYYGQYPHKPKPSPK